MNVVAFTRPDIFKHWATGPLSYPYDRLVGLWHNDGYFGRYVGDRSEDIHAERELTLAPEIGERLLGVFEDITNGNITNCHGFSRQLASLPPSTSEPWKCYADLPKTNHLDVGAIGLIGVSGLGVLHSIGCGLGEDSLQVMSFRGEIGIAGNAPVLEFYQQLFSNRDVGMYQMPQA